MDEVARGIASAALTLQSVLLQALVVKGVLTPVEGIEVADKALEAASDIEGDEDQETAGVTVACLHEVREGLVSMLGRS
jgi:hypothetical protein